MQGPSLTLHRGLGLHQPVKEDYGTSVFQSSAAITSTITVTGELETATLQVIKQQIYIKIQPVQKKKKLYHFQLVFNFFGYLNY